MDGIKTNILCCMIRDVTGFPWKGNFRVVGRMAELPLSQPGSLRRSVQNRGVFSCALPHGVSNAHLLVRNSSVCFATSENVLNQCQYISHEKLFLALVFKHKGNDESFASEMAAVQYSEAVIRRYSNQPMDALVLLTGEERKMVLAYFLLSCKAPTRFLYDFP